MYQVSTVVHWVKEFKPDQRAEKAFVSPTFFLNFNSINSYDLDFSVTSIFTEQVLLFLGARLRVLDFLAILKTNRWPWSLFCSLIGLLSLLHVPHFNSQCYHINIFKDIWHVSDTCRYKVVCVLRVNLLIKVNIFVVITVLFSIPTHIRN